MAQVRPARPSDAAAIAGSLRETDRRDIQAALGEDPWVVVSRGIARSRPCYAAVDGQDRAFAVFGVIPVSSAPGLGVAWLLASRELARHRLYFLRHSRAWVGKLQESYAVLWNCVDARNEDYLPWLEWCGFRVLGRIEQFGAEGRPFYEIQRSRETGPGGLG